MIDGLILGCELGEPDKLGNAEGIDDGIIDTDGDSDGIVVGQSDTEGFIDGLSKEESVNHVNYTDQRTIKS